MEVRRKEFEDLKIRVDKMDRCIIGLEASDKIATEHRKEVELVLWKEGEKAVVPTVARIEQKVDDLGSLIQNGGGKLSGNPGKRSSGDSDRNIGEPITFKWAAEKFGVPFLFLIAAIVLAIIFGTG